VFKAISALQVRQVLLASRVLQVQLVVSESQATPVIPAFPADLDPGVLPAPWVVLDRLERRVSLGCQDQVDFRAVLEHQGRLDRQGTLDLRDSLAIPVLKDLSAH